MALLLVVVGASGSDGDDNGGRGGRGGGGGGGGGGEESGATESGRESGGVVAESRPAAGIDAGLWGSLESSNVPFLGVSSSPKELLLLLSFDPSHEEDEEDEERADPEDDPHGPPADDTASSSRAWFESLLRCAICPALFHPSSVFVFDASSILAGSMAGDGVCLSPRVGPHDDDVEFVGLRLDNKRERS